MRYIILFSILNILSYTVHAQQVPLISQYMFNKLLVNPAYVGNQNILSTTLTYNRQFNDLEGSPETQTLSIHAPIQSKSMGLGLKFLHDKIGVTDQVAITGIYGFQVGFGPGKLSLALEGGISSSTVDYLVLDRKDMFDEAIPDAKQSEFSYDASFGVYYSTGRMYSGVSVLHLLAKKMDGSIPNSELRPFLSKHYYAIGGYVMNLNAILSLEPSLLFKYVSSIPPQLDFNLKAVYKKMLAVGISYRSIDFASFILEYNLNEALRVGYAYDINLANVGLSSTGSHEIALNYSIQLPDPPRRKSVDPRFYY